ncbi:MAG: uracil phosphoribosyltransferase, partial [Bacteroidaceae bacterium]|nr:uracil phosphoribosyltransferase [Bacteroidaceae bacterium]
MKVIDMSQTNSILNQYVAELRDENIQKDAMRFRRNIERIGQIQAYEISKQLSYSQKFVNTPLGVATANTHDDTVVLGTVFRAGLPLHQGFLSFFDQAENAFVSAYRYYKNADHTDVDVHLEYIATPNPAGKT